MSIIKAVSIAATGMALAAANTTRPIQTYGRYTVPHAEDLGLPSWAIPEVTNKEAVMRFGLWIRAETKPEEQQLLMTLLRSGDRDPAAVNLLKELIAAKDSGKKRSSVDAKERRMQSLQDSCASQSTQEACTAETDFQCVGCTWRTRSGDSDESCGIAQCEDYQAEETCCGNAGGVITGCYWGLPWVTAETPVCKPMECSRLLDVGTCEPLGASGGTACKWTAECDCIDQANSCVADDNGFFLNTPPASPVVDSLCPPMDCAACLKGSTTSDDASIDWANQDRVTSCTEMKSSALDGACKERCEDAVHCGEEVECLMHKTKALDPCMAYACTENAANPSCEAAKTAEAKQTSTIGDYSDCDDSQCNEFQEDCGSCGDKACKMRKEGQEAFAALIVGIIIAVVISICCCIACCVFCCVMANKKKTPQPLPSQDQQQPQGQPIGV